MPAQEPVGPTGFPPPDPRRRAWPVLADPVPNAEPSSRGSQLWLSAVALLLAAIGVVGAVLPALDGQKVGDPDSSAFRLGVPLGFLGGALAITLASIVLARSAQSVWPKVISIVSISIGGMALFLTAALVFSG